MRIGLFTESFLPVVNGVTTSVQVLRRELLNHGHSPTVIAPYYPGHQDDDVSVLRLPSWRTPLNPKNPFAFPPIGPVPHALQGLMFDIVHTQHPFGIGMHGAATAQRLQVPVISTFHTLYMEYAHYFPLLPNDMIVSTINQHLKQYYSRCQRVIVPSRESERRLVQIGVPPEKITVIPTGVPDAPPIALDEMEKARSEFHLPKDIPIILFVGRLAKEKNLALLIHAFARLRTALVAPEPIHLVLVGDGPYRETCEQLARDCGVADAVQFTGFLTKQQLAPLYAAATLFAFPSSSETQGVVLSEAQSFGLPCVVVRGGGASESVREGIDALVVEPLPETFSKAMADLINDPDQRHAFSIAAQTNPLRLTPEKMVDCIIDVYTSAIAQSHV